jgi:hypothetical protein
MLSLIAQNMSDFSPTYDSSAAAAAATASLGLGIGLVIFFWILGLVGIVLWIWALIDVIKREFSNPNDKIIWIIVILLIWIIGPLIYLIAGRKKGHIPGAKPAQQ